MAEREGLFLATLVTPSGPLPAAAFCAASPLVEPANQLSRIQIHHQQSIEKGREAPFLWMAEREGLFLATLVTPSGPLPAAAFCAASPLVEPANRLSRIQIHHQQSIEKGREAPFLWMAEREGFEPSMFFFNRL